MNLSECIGNCRWTNASNGAVADKLRAACPSLKSKSKKLRNKVDGAISNSDERKPGPGRVVIEEPDRMICNRAIGCGTIFLISSFL